MRTFISRMLDVIVRRRREDRLSEEIQAHLDLLVDEHVANGLSPDDARLAARKAFGGVDQAKMRYREQRGLPGVDALLQDVRFAVRVLTRDRAFALTAILVPTTEIAAPTTAVCRLGSCHLDVADQASRGPGARRRPRDLVIW